MERRMAKSAERCASYRLISLGKPDGRDVSRNFRTFRSVSLGLRDYAAGCHLCPWRPPHADPRRPARRVFRMLLKGQGGVFPAA